VSQRNITLRLSARRWNVLRALLNGTANSTGDAIVRGMCLEAIRQIDTAVGRMQPTPKRRPDGGTIGLRRSARLRTSLGG
jgi:hypothetical protein